MAWLAGWSYRKEISITGQTGAGTDYQVPFEIGDSAGGDFHLEGNCTSFPQDIAVTDNDETTLLDFWIEDITADPIKMWVEVADDLGTNQTIYVYYGKAESPTASNIENTFLFGDDFPGSSIDTEKWTVTGTIGVSNSEATLNEDDALDSIATFGFETIVTARSKADEQDSSFVGYKYDASNRTQVQNSDFIASDDFDNIMLIPIKAGSNPTPYPQNQWSDFRNTYYQYTIKRISSSLIEYSQDSNSNTYTDTAYIATQDMHVGIYTWDSSQASTLTCDWIFVRKYNSTEPAFSSAGSEETPAADTSTDLLHGKIIIKDSSIILVDGLIQVKDSVTNLFDGELKVIEKVTSLADGKIQVQDVATSLTDGKLQVKDSATTFADGKVQIQDIDTNLADGKLQVQDVDTDLADGIIQVKDSITSLADGKVQIRDTDIDLADGKVKVQDSATGLADGLLRVQDKATGLTDGKVQIQDTDTDLADGLIKVQDSVSDLADGKVIVTTAGIDTGLADGKIQIKDVATGIVDGLLKIVVAISRISIGNLKPSFRLITKNQKTSYRLIAEQPKSTYRLKTENK